jgi:hypothetical protein
MNDYTKVGYAVILTDDAIIMTKKSEINKLMQHLTIDIKHPKLITDRTIPITNQTDQQTSANHVVHNELDANVVTGGMHV